MAGGTRRSLSNIRREARDPAPTKRPAPQIFPRVINVAWASIADGDLMPGELVFNRNGNDFVYRKDNTNIYRFDSVATRAI